MAKTKTIAEARPRNERGQYIPANKSAGKGGMKTTLSKEERITEHIIRMAVDRSFKDIQSWQTALMSAEDVYIPMRSLLYDLYYSLRKDAHIMMIRKQLYSWLKSGKIQIVDENTYKVDKAMTKQFSKQWFKNLSEFFVDSKFEGYRLMQFDEINPVTGKIAFDIVNPKHVRPETGEWCVWQFDLPGSGTKYRNDPKAMAWMLEIGKPMDLGLLDPCAPYIIYKKCAMQAWAQFCDRFGIPLAKGKVNAADTKAVARMQNFFTTMSGASWAIIDHAEEIEFVQQSSTDAFDVFDKFIERHNSEMSKMILLNVMANDVGKNGSRAQSQTHQDVTNDPKSALRDEWESYTTEHILPLLAQHGFNVNGKIAQYAREVKISKEEVETDQWLMDNFDIPLDYWTEKYNMPATGFKTKPAAPIVPPIAPKKGKAAKVPKPGEDDPEDGGEDVANMVKKLLDAVNKLQELYPHAGT